MYMSTPNAAAGRSPSPMNIGSPVSSPGSAPRHAWNTSAALHGSFLAANEPQSPQLNLYQQQQSGRVGQLDQSGAGRFGGAQSSAASRALMQTEEKAREQYAPAYLFGSSTPANTSLTSWSARAGASHNTSLTGENLSSSSAAPLKEADFRRPSLNTTAQRLQAATNKEKVTWSPDLVQEIPAKSRRATIGGVSLPPLRSLNDSVSQSPLARPPASSTQQQSALLDQSQLLDRSQAFDRSQAIERSTDADIDVLASATIDPHWVTIFGFPSDALPFILETFARYGTIQSHQVPERGNWLHVRFQSTLQAKRALSKNATVLGGHLQIGVVPCADQAMIARVNDELASGGLLLNESNHHDMSQMVTAESMNESRLGAAGDQSARLNRSQLNASSIRPLTEASANRPFAFNNHNTPQKQDSGLLSRTMNYIFGPNDQP